MRRVGKERKEKRIEVKGKEEKNRRGEREEKGRKDCDGKNKFIQHYLNYK